MIPPRLILPKLTLPILLAGIVLALLPPMGAQAAPLNPRSFASLGSNPFTQTGAYTVNTGATPPTLSGPGISSPIRGAVSSAGVAVFTFNSITLPQGATLSAVRGTARPLALLSQGGADIEGTIDVSGAYPGLDINSGKPGGAGGPGGAAGGADSRNGNGGPGSSVEPGGGGSGGQAGPQYSGTTYGGGGGFGMAGSNSGSASGRPYGDLLIKLEGGSGGGGAGAQQFSPGPGYFYSVAGGAGGGGGGAIEIGATGAVTLAGVVDADGATGGGYSGGGGAGGGILVHGTDIAVTASLTLSALGGSGGGSGGGGRIVLEANGGFITGDIDGATIFPDPNNSQVKTVGTVIPYAEDNDPSDRAAQVPHRSTSGVNLTLTASSARPNGSETDALVYSLLGTNGGAQHGTVTLSGRTATYKPNLAANYVGTDTFRFTVYDSTLGLPGDHTGTITVTLTNVAPVAQADGYRTSQNTTLTVSTPGVLTNDTDADGDKLSALIVTQPAHAASFALRADGSFTYAPVAGYFGTDSFTYKANDGYADSNTAAVTLTVVGAPTANSQTVSVPFNTAKTVTLTGSDPNSPPQALTYTVVTGTAHGTLSGTAPSLTYTPTAGYQGADSFTFRVSNGTSTSSTATVSLTVTAGTPAANAQSVSVAFNTAKAVTLTGSDPDSPPLALTYTVVTGPAHGTLTGTAPNLTYTPTSGYHGADSFTFTVGNGTNTSTTATVSLTIAQGAASDVTAQITLTRGGFRYVRATGHYLQPITLTNTGAALADPLSLVLDGLAGATLVGASGTTSDAAPAGSPYVTLPMGGLAAGASATVTLEFSAQPTGYTLRVLAGPGAR